MKTHKNSGNMVPSDAFAVFIKFMSDTMKRLDMLEEELKLQNPDLIIYDPMSLWGQILAKGFNYKKITFYTTYPMIPGDTMSGNMTDMFKQCISIRIIMPAIRLVLAIYKAKWKYKIKELSFRTLFTAKEDLNLVPLPKGILPNADKLDESYLFFGPSIMTNYSNQGEKIPVLNGKRRLYVSMGSTPLNSQPELFLVCIAAFRNTEWSVIMNIGETKKESLGDIPDNILVRNYIPQIEVLENSDVFLTHGGMNSVMESLYFRVPLMVYALQPETQITGKQIEPKKIGVNLYASDINANKLREIADSLYSNPQYKANTSIISEELRMLGGAKLAADTIEKYCNK